MHRYVSRCVVHLPNLPVVWYKIQTYLLFTRLQCGNCLEKSQLSSWFYPIEMPWSLESKSWLPIQVVNLVRYIVFSGSIGGSELDAGTTLETEVAGN